jgi:uncharacterized membrane protein YdjX (TVP38/TMEM64 family)
VEIYLAAAIAIVLLNAVPAFAPPTWMALVFFLLHYDANPVAIVIIGVISATTGRAVLAWYFRRFAHLVPTKFSQNMEYAGQYFTDHSNKRFALLSIFFLSPVSSAQLFEAAGLMKTISLKPLLAAFAVGRSFTYTTYVTGASVIAATSFGEIIISELKSPWAIAVQIVMIAGLVALGSVDWKKRLKR